ncbi:Brain protein I3 [Aphelenchoides besseyi]|nr:Brain protein I3 [Aphelenchoides besseyi]
MGKKTQSDQQTVPSAPPEQSPEHAYPTLNAANQPVSPVNQSPPPTYGTNDTTPPTNSGYSPQLNAMGPQGSNADDADLPAPPSYDQAISCPSAPPYLPYGAPKPAYMSGPQHGQPIYPPPISGTGFVLNAPGQSDFDTASNGTPQPRIIHTTVISQPAGNTCVHCFSGEVHNETDLCCLLCLILFAIFTFPLGLILLFCVPCSVRRRCARCRRLN